MKQIINTLNLLKEVLIYGMVASIRFCDVFGAKCQLLDSLGRTLQEINEKNIKNG